MSTVQDDLLRKILKEYRRIAVVGMSNNPEKPARRIPAFFIARGYHVIPVNPFHEKILGRKAYPSLLEVPDDIDVVNVFRPSEEIPKVVEQVLARLRERGDVKVLWLQEGIRHDEAARQAEEAGLVVIQDRCMYKEYIRLFGEEGHGG